MLHIAKENIQQLKYEIETDIIIAERKQSTFAKKVPLDILKRMIEFIDFKMAETEMLNNEIRERDEQIRLLRNSIDYKKEELKRLREPIKKAIPETQNIETIRKDAVAILRTECIGDSEFMELAKQLGADALAKEIPQKPNNKATVSIYGDITSHCGVCPSCNEFQYFAKLPNKKTYIHRCGECGQALDWGDDDA